MDKNKFCILILTNLNKVLPIPINSIYAETIINTIDAYYLLEEKKYATALKELMKIANRENAQSESLQMDIFDET